MTIDNFDLFRKHLTFKDKTDRYIVHVLCRPKDIPEDQRTLGSNEHQRLIRTYYIDSLEYFDKKVEAIKTLCKQNHARGYILPQVRNNYECLLNLGEKVLQTIRLGNYSVKPEHMLRSAYCEYHKSRDKKWILDLDEDNMIEFIVEKKKSELGSYMVDHVVGREWSVEAVLELVQDMLKKCGKSADEAYMVPTRSGCHIVTSPFDLKEAFKTCSMLFEGRELVRVPGFVTWPNGATSPADKMMNGWLIKDGMSLLYYTDEV